MPNALLEDLDIAMENVLGEIRTNDVQAGTNISCVQSICVCPQTQCTICSSQTQTCFPGKCG